MASDGILCNRLIYLSGGAFSPSLVFLSQSNDRLGRALHKPDTLGQCSQRDFTGYCHLSPPRARWELGSILPIAHPTNHHGFLRWWQVIERQRAVAILSPIAPECERAGVFVQESGSVKLPDKVLLARAPLHSARVQAHL